MAKGGKRLGAGRKPMARRERWLGGNAGKRNLALVTSLPVPVVASDTPAPSAPAVLTPSESQYWELWAPLAHARGTLHGGTLPGFVLLCQQAAFAAAVRACIESRGYEQEKVTIDGAGQEHREYKANSLISQWRGLMTRVEQLQARYGLAADGKVVATAAVDDEEQRLAEILAVT